MSNIPDEAYAACGFLDASASFKNPVVQPGVIYPEIICHGMIEQKVRCDEVRRPQTFPIQILI